MAVRIRLCGDIEVEVDGERRDGRLRGRHGRMLLVQLVLNRSRAVSRSELIDALWGEALPHDPSASLRAHLSRLRSTWEPTR
jgi:DNA-binding SARP family transcriptional activator